MGFFGINSKKKKKKGKENQRLVNPENQLALTLELVKF